MRVPKLLIVATVMFAVSMALAQNDVIYLHDGKQIKAKVLQHNAGELHYQILPDGNLSRISIAGVKMIQYSDGHKVNYVCSGCAGTFAGNSSGGTVSSGAQSEAALDGGEEWVSEEGDDDISELRLYFTEGTDEYKERQKRLKKIDKHLVRMQKAGLVMGAFDIFGVGTGTIGGAAAAGAAYGFLNVARKGIDEMEKAIQAAGGWVIVTGATDGAGTTIINGRCDDRKKEVEVIRKTITKQAVLAAGVSAGVALAVKNAAQTKNLGDIKYGVLATSAVALAIPELKLQNRVVKLARKSVESCRD